MLEVNYKNRIGYFIEKQTRGDKTYKYKMWFCHANALCAIMYFYKDDKGVDMVRLHGFFGDIKHAKACIKGGIFDNCENFHFYAEQMGPDIWTLVKELIKSGKKVTIE